ncbi:MAG TPA: hypothetical protein VFN61_00015 [Acidimicrobiales bacterium]|nr:hypothetical protein [Acidimicrobiales bacterium]
MTTGWRELIFPPSQAGAQSQAGAATGPGATDLAPGPERNSRLTVATAVVLLVILAAEGATLLSVRRLLSWHIFLGMLVVPPVLLKLGSTSYRFARYYLGSPPYRQKGPPPPVLRLLGPLVALSTIGLLATGLGLVVLSPASPWQARMLLAHKASFVIWFGAMTVHVLGHIAETARIAPRDWVRSTRQPGAGARHWLVALSVAAGVPLGLAFMGRASWWLGNVHLHH